jgi:hypothetical protein
MPEACRSRPIGVVRSIVRSGREPASKKRRVRFNGARIAPGEWARPTLQSWSSTAIRGSSRRLTSFLDGRGYNVRSASRFASATQALATRPFDVVLLELYLPTGTATTSSSARARPRPAVIVRRLALAKPIDPRSLLDAVARHLDRPSRRELRAARDRAVRRGRWSTSLARWRGSQGNRALLQRFVDPFRDEAKTARRRLPREGRRVRRGGTSLRGAPSPRSGAQSRRRAPRRRARDARSDARPWRLAEVRAIARRRRRGDRPAAGGAGARRTDNCGLTTTDAAPGPGQRLRHRISRETEM